ncbi:hypothetical protein [Tropicimonas sp. IMCC34011]|uniref:hypothetical protein n=1 Tax=Tropicimonas sp. IMCC34011 TaxID=2248759 RepID=UPI001300A654|nr:hypothetical protein [Tropicimonas sp. IMCC34011]
MIEPPGKPLYLSSRPGLTLGDILRSTASNIAHSVAMPRTGAEGAIAAMRYGLNHG